MSKNLIHYYNRRAEEYDDVYTIPEEQNDLARSVQIFQDLFAEKSLIEVVCGTGHWTKHIAVTAHSVFATDANERMVAIAKEKIKATNVRLEVADVYALPETKKYDGFFGGFIWSHILLQDQDLILKKALRFLKPNRVFAFIDSKPVDYTSDDKKRISYTDKSGNTFQIRHLEDGSTLLVLKNFPTKEFLVEKLKPFSMEVEYIDLEYYWIVVGKLK